MKTKKMQAHVKQTEPHSPWQNAAEGMIRKVKRGSGRKMLKKKVPAKLWDHAVEYEGLVRSHTALDSYELDGQVPETIVLGQTADISPIVEHGFYDWVKWYNSEAQFPEPKEVYGRWLGPAPDIGPAMCSKILKKNGQVLYLSSYRAVTDDEMADPREKEVRDAFDKEICERLGNPLSPDELKDFDEEAVTPEYEYYEDDKENRAPTPDAEDVTPEEMDNYVGAEVNLPIAGVLRAGKVKRRARDEEGNVFGRKHNNPILDTRQYEVEFPDGQVHEYTANVIAENMYSQCDVNGNQFLLLESISDHKASEDAVKDADRFVTVNGRQYPRKTTAGWKLCVGWKDGSTSWERLADLKESFPIEVAEYAVAQGINSEPAFAWWVPYVLRKRDRIIAAVNKPYHKPLVWN